LTRRRTRLQPTSWKSCILQAGKAARAAILGKRKSQKFPRTAGGCPKLDLREHYKLEINDKLEISLLQKLLGSGAAIVYSIHI